MSIFDIIITIYLIAIGLGMLASFALGNRWWRPLLIVGVLSLSVLALWWPGENGYGPSERLKPGLDLAGGTSLIYDVSIPQGKDPKKVINDTIAILSARVDPTGTRNLAWKQVAGNRIEIQMPLATAETATRRHDYLDARDKLLKHNLNKSTLIADLRLAPKERSQSFDQLADNNKLLGSELDRLAKLYDNLVAKTKPYHQAEQTLRKSQNQLNTLIQKAASPSTQIDKKTTASKKTQTQASSLNKQISQLKKDINNQIKALVPITQAYLIAQEKYQTQLDATLQSNISQQEIEKVFSLKDTSEKSGQPSPRAAALQKLKKEHPSRAAQIDVVAKAYSSYEQVKGPLDDPQDLMQLLRGSGVLEFRIAASPQTVGDVQGYRQNLLQHGPTVDPSKAWAWFAIDKVSSFADTKELQKAAKENPQQYFAGRGMIAQKYNGKIYLLLGNQPDTAMTREEQGWTLSSASQTRDQLGGLAISFNLNPIGGQRMGQITGPHIKMPMAILMDNKVISAPTLQSKIEARGQITGGPGGFSQKEETYLLRTLKAGSLEGQLAPFPESVNTIGPTLGQDNLRAGISAVIWSLIAVSLFMALYYFFNGVIANFALYANLVIILGVMAMLHATFTMAGIAGVVLTIGMAVDANVLISERIREELMRNADVATAVRLGYSRALSTVVDANLTTLIVAVVLGYTATSDIKGFAVTLGIGILATLFTALFATHVLMDLYVRYYKPKSMRMLPIVSKTVHRIFSPNINWVKHRYIIFSISAVLSIASLCLVYVRGANMLDIEFRSGTQVSFALPAHEAMPISTVRQRFQTYGQVGQMIKQGNVDVSQLSPKQQLAYKNIQIIQNSVKSRQQQLMASYQTKIKAGQHPDKPSTQPVNFALLGEVQPVTLGQTTKGSNGEIEAHKFKISTLITDANAVSDVVKAAFPELKTTRSINFAGMNISKDEMGKAPVEPIVRANSKGQAILGLNIDRPDVQTDVTSYLGGVAIVLKDLHPAPTVASVTQRINRMSRRPAFANLGFRNFKVIGIDPIASTDNGPTRYKSIAVVAKDNKTNYQKNPQNLTNSTGLAATEWSLVKNALQRDTSLAGVSSFSSQVSSSMENRALMAIFLSLIAMIIYVWFRFGRLTYGLAAVVALVHDIIIALGALALSAWIYDNPAGHFLLLEPFKINLAIVAALLTIIGFSMNDTVVVFDRIRENRGRLSYVTPKIINDGINQTFSRTVITSGTAMIAILILYFIGGPGIHGFAYAMVVGVFTGTYSSIAIASPLLLIRPLDKAKIPDEANDTIVKNPAKA